MDKLYTVSSLKCSKLVTQMYSTSFTLGIRTLDRKFQLPIYAIYGFVRFADEIVDTHKGSDTKQLLARFKDDTFEAILAGVSLNPILHSFQIIVNKYRIDHDLILAFLNSMEMDLNDVTYSETDYQKYIYGSAEVVGLMCLRVFCEGNNDLYKKLAPSAKSLGSAFQKVNFLRDFKSDFKDRGRVYFPGVDFNAFGQIQKEQIEQEIAIDFQKALLGIRELPKGCRAGVYLAYVYYIQLFKKIRKLPSEKILLQRIRIPNPIKLLLLTKTLLLHKMNQLV